MLSISAGVHPDLSPADMVSTAASAGWPACGIWFDGTTWSDRTTAEVRRRLDDTGIVALDVEPIIPADGSEDHAERLIEAAAHLGARFVLFTSRLKDHRATADRYAEACAMAEPHGITVVCEFLPIFPLSTIDLANQVVTGVRSRNVGILVDNLHLSRSGGSVADVRRLGPGRFPYLQIADAPIERPADMSALFDEALNGRLLPGDGELPISDLLEAVPDVALSFEVRSRFLRATYSDPVARARIVLEAARRTCV
ncbi:MAG: sugar phosphate isomerase/epimerase family protein [Actinomycetota bacterium]